MKWFSQRKGLKKVRKVIQVDSMDNELRISLWNALTICYWNHYYSYDEQEMETFLKKIWIYYFKKPVDTLAGDWYHNLNEIREYFFECEWNEVYDFLEYVASTFPHDEANKDFEKACNSFLETESSAYRFVGGQIVQITFEEEISEIEKALDTPLKPIRVHIENALKLMSDRKSPDYRNSIKESISAVEAICKLITKDRKATLGQALKIVEKKIGLHGALKNAFSNLYGYTSSAEGIRHALLDQRISLSFEDAKFMLVSCSAFINYLVSKAQKAGIKL